MERLACRADFAKHLLFAARSLLAEAIESVPCPTIRRHRARAKALDAFERDLHRNGSGIYADQPEVLRIRGEKL